MPPVALPVGGRHEPLAACAQVVLAQQAAGIGREAGKEKVLDERQTRVRRRLCMEAGNPGLGAQVVEVDPARRRPQLRHRLDEGFGNPAGEGFEDDWRRHHRGPPRFPAAQLDSLQPLARQLGIDDRAEPPEAVEIIDPQANALPVLAGELPGEPPADPDVAEIVDHPAEDVPVGAGGKGWHGRCGQA
jgi:hypothetical protein